MMNVIGVLTVQLCINTWGYVFFNLGEFPVWADGAYCSNETLANTSYMHITTDTYNLLDATTVDVK